MGISKQEKDQLISAFSKIDDQRVRYFFAMLAGIVGEALSEKEPTAPIKNNTKISAIKAQPH